MTLTMNKVPMACKVQIENSGLDYITVGNLDLISLQKARTKFNKLISCTNQNMSLQCMIAQTYRRKLLVKSNEFKIANVK